jgi:hypothetical protein
MLSLQHGVESCRGIEMAIVLKHNGKVRYSERLYRDVDYGNIWRWAHEV